jgi:DNA-binding MarR family transcriptional regulator/GNAT superfamily N-acetyltransferase
MPDAVTAVRSFSRFYTEVLGLLGGALLATPYSLTEARVLFELAQPGQVSTLDLRQRLGLDPGYLSRILARFEAGGLVVRERSAADGRRQVLRLTEHGREVQADLDARSTAQVADLLAAADAGQQKALVEALGTARAILAGAAPAGETPPARETAPARGPVTLRGLRPGDLGWVVQRHGVRYGAEYGFDVTFEGLVAHIVGDYARSPHRAKQNAWIAELGGEPVGSILCTRHDDRVAQLRLLFVEPQARGAGVGTALVTECLRFAAGAGYREIMLWTNDILHAARRIYERAGFRLEHEGPQPNFGVGLTEQVWRRDLP